MAFSFGEELSTSSKMTVTESVYDEKTLQGDTLTISEEKQPDLRDRLEAALPDTVDFLLQSANSMDWVVSGLGRLEGYRHRIPSDYVGSRVPIVQDQAELQDQGDRSFKITEFERMTIGIVAAGGNPRDVGGIDLIERIYNPRYKDDGTDYITNQGINAVIFGLIAVDTRDYEVPDNAVWTRERMIDEILSKEITASNGAVGGWALYGNVPDPDITGMAMIALGPYSDGNPQVRAAVKRAADVLASLQIQEGEFAGGYYSWGTVNVESCVQVVMGLTANNIDPFSEEFVKNGNAIGDAILKFKVPGGFTHSFEASPGSEPGQPNGMASEQALYGIAQLLYYMDGNQGSIFRWGEEIPTVDKTALKAKLKEAKAIEKANYTEVSYKVLQNAIAKAEIILAKEDATQKEVNQGTQLLVDTMKSLVYLVHKIIAVPDTEGKAHISEDEVKYALVEITVPKNVTSLQIQMPNSNESTKIVLEDKVLSYIEAERKNHKGNVIKLIIKEGTKITTGADIVELPKIISSQESLKAAEEKINQILKTEAKKVKSISDYIIAGSEVESIALDQPITMIVGTDIEKQIAYIDHLGNVKIIDKVANEEEGQAKKLDAYAYFDGNAMVIRTKHLASFVLYDTEEGSTNPVDPENPENPDKIVTVQIRVEGYDRTVVPMRTITTSVFGLDEYLGPASGSSATPSAGWGEDRFPNGPTAAHATVEALEQVRARYDFQDYGWSLYIAMIDGNREFDHRSTSGWMYRVNGVLPNFGCQEYVLSDGDVIEWYFGAYGFETLFTKMEADKTNAKTGEEITITLIGEKTDLSAPSGIGATVRSKVGNAQIHVNGSPYKENGKEVITDSEGKATLKFLSPGSYTISAERVNKEGLKDIVRPIGIVINVTGETISPTNIEMENEKYQNEFKIIIDEKSKEEEILKALENAYEKLQKTAEEIQTDDKALQIASEVKDVLNLINLATDRITIEENFKFLIEIQKKVVEVLIKALEKAEKYETIEKSVSIFEVEVLNLTEKIREKVNDLDTKVNLFINIADIWRQIRSIGELEEKKEVDEKVMQFLEEVIEALTVIDFKEKSMEIGGDVSTVELNEEEIINKAKGVKSHLEKVNRVMLENDRNSSKRKITNDLVIKLPITGDERSEIKMSSKLLGEIKEEIVSLRLVDDRATIEIKPSTFGSLDNKEDEITIQIEKIGEVTKINITDKLEEPIKVTIPYNLEEDNKDNLAAILITEEGNRIIMGGVYDEENEGVTFLTNSEGGIVIEHVERKFDDLNGFEWAQRDIEKMASKGIISGKNNQTFDPSGTLTRAEFATLMFKILKYPPKDDIDMMFADIKENDWYYIPVATVFDKGLISGKSKTSFDPNGNITNQELAVILSKTLVSYGFIQEDMEILGRFEDAEKIDQWAKEGVALLAANDILLEQENFNPLKPVNRAEATYMISRLYDLMMK